MLETLLYGSSFENVRSLIMANLDSLKAGIVSFTQSYSNIRAEGLVGRRLLVYQ